MRIFSLIAFTAACAAASAAATAATVPANSILFSRHVLQPFGDDGYKALASSALFTVDANGDHLRQLTPQEDGHFFLPGVESDTGIWYEFTTINWLSKNFSAKGKQLLFFNGRSSTFPTQQYSLSGKYKIRDSDGHTRNLFPGADDVASGRGFVTWGPPGSGWIAYTNSAEAHPASPACVFLIHPDGTGAHALWCAKGFGPSVGLTGLRWSGNGKYLLVGVNIDDIYGPPNFGFYSTGDLWRVKVATGAAQHVADARGEPAEISYDGNKILYLAAGVDDPSEGGCAGYVGNTQLICMKDMETGQMKVVSFKYQHQEGHMLLSPDATRTVTYDFNQQSPYPGYSEIDISLVRTADGTVVRQLTKPPAAGWPQGSYVTWRAVAWSPDGNRLLANRDVVLDGEAIPETSFFVINLAKGSVRRVGDGDAIDWYQPAW